MNVLEEFPAYVANGWGLYKPRASLTIKCINQMPSGLRSLSESVGGRSVAVETGEIFCSRFTGNQNSDELKRLFDSYGSDKAKGHQYHRIYAALLADCRTVNKILEIGLGTNNRDVVSTMGKHGSPGASLRAFRDFCPDAQVYGADFDSRVLFAEDRIDTFFVDQTAIQTFAALGEKIGVDFDLMIDDGLHAPNANIHSLTFFLSRLRVGGWAVVEDIAIETVDFWHLVCGLLPDRFEPNLLQTRTALMLAVKRLA